MSENFETIEARLCAYVEGELDEQGKAEIEKHLLANPHHRRLLDELSAQRTLLRRLPRDPAPPELAESFKRHHESAAQFKAPRAQDPF
jgi:anti-sigma factor RsiW